MSVIVSAVLPSGFYYFNVIVGKYQGIFVMLNTLVLNQDGQDFQDEGSVLCIWENVSSGPSDLSL